MEPVSLPPGDENPQVEEAIAETVTEAAEAQFSEPEPTDAPGWAVRAGDLSYDGLYVEAVMACDRALTLDPPHVGRFG